MNKQVNKTDRSGYMSTYYQNKRPDSLNPAYVCVVCDSQGYKTNITTKSGKRKHLSSKRHDKNTKKLICGNEYN